MHTYRLLEVEENIIFCYVHVNWLDVIEMTHAEEIMHAVVDLVKRRKKWFTRKEVRDAIGVDPHEWLYGYTAIFQSMRADHPGGAPEIGRKFRAVFQRIERGKYVLTTYGKHLAEELGSSS